MKILYSLLVFVLMNSALTAQNELPGDTSLPSSKEELAKLAQKETGSFPYSVKDYFEKPKQSSFKLSPNGTYFSYQEKDAEGKRHVYIKSIETGEVNRAIEEKEELIRGYGWANDSRLIYLMDKGGNENYHLYAVNIDGSNSKELTPFEGVRVSILNGLKERPDHIIVSMNKNNPQVFEPYLLDINTGELEQLFENKDITSPIGGYDFDKDGKLRGYTKQVDGINYDLYYRTSDDAEFKPIVHTTWKDNFYILAFDYASNNPHEAYVVSNLDSDTDEIIKYDLKENKIIEKVYSHPTFDVSNIGRSRKRGYELDYISYNGEKYQIEPVSAYFKDLYATFKSRFGEESVSITSKTDNEDIYLLYVSSDRNYGSYYSYDVNSKKFTKLLDLMPQLDPKDMAEMRPIKFKSRDGLDMYGYLTIPNGASSENPVPMIVNPHGGPYGPRDSWGFNPETQLFASRGYATLQINYRGSGGYGKKFSQAGNRQIGRKMLDDLEDGVAYAKSLGFIKKDKVAIYGASYGGLATLGSLVKTPDLYVCGVDYVGVSNLFTFYESFPPYWKPYLAQVKEQWYDFDSEEDQKIMREVSPALNVEKITKPIFVIQGANDPRVVINESDQIVKNLRDRDIEVPYMVKYNEGHGFGHEENRIELYESMMGFFYQHLK